MIGKRDQPFHFVQIAYMIALLNSPPYVVLKTNWMTTLLTFGCVRPSRQCMLWVASDECRVVHVGRVDADDAALGAE